MQRKNAVGFFYSWAPSRQLDGYFSKVAEAISLLGYDLKIILGSDFLDERGHQVPNLQVNQAKLLQYIKDIDPAFVFSVNNAGMYQRIQTQLDCPVIKWFVDDLPHVFLPDGVDSLPHLLSYGETAFTYSSTLQHSLQEKYPQAHDRIHFSHHATDIERMRMSRGHSNYGISFVASCLDTEPLAKLLKSLRSDRKFTAIEGIFVLLRELGKDYEIDFESRFKDLGLESILIPRGLTWLDLKRVLSDVLTTQSRAKAVIALQDLNFNLFGNERWLETLGVDSGVASSFRFERAVSKFDDLADVYQSSKISVNVPNIQNVNGLAARVFDIMASNSLLICDEAGGHDLRRIFGVDCPVPVYRDLKELRSLCELYLRDESLRIQKVRECQSCLTAEFDFTQVIGRMLARGGVSLSHTGPGTIEYISRFKFITLPAMLRKTSRFAFLKGLQLVRRALSSLLGKS